MNPFLDEGSREQGSSFHLEGCDPVDGQASPNGPLVIWTGQVKGISQTSFARDPP
jgi:hypothetical protein